VINNSFVFRDVQTEKSELYLAVDVADSGRLQIPPRVARLYEPPMSDFRRLAQKQPDRPFRICRRPSRPSARTLVI